MNPHNNNCDGSYCTSSMGEVRLLPTGSDGNMILCHSCFCHEISYRKNRNKDLSKFAKFKLPSWESLKIYPDLTLTEGGVE